MLWRHTHPAFHAIIMAIIGFSAFSLGDASSKFLVQTYSVHQILATSSFITLVCSGLWAWQSSPGLTGFKTKRLKWHMIRGAFVACVAMSVVYGLSYVPLADFYGIIFLSPILVLLLSGVFLKEKIGMARLLCCLVGFIGVLIIAGPQFSQASVGIALVFCAMIFVALSAIAVRKIGADDPLPLFAFFPAIFVFATNAPFAVFDFQTPTLLAACFFIFNGFMILFGQYFTAVGYARAAETSAVAPFAYIQMVWGVTLGFLLFGDLPSAATLGGSALIIGSNLFIILREHRLHKRRILPEMQH